jgi:putative SOS response-associated peptidase YedK
MFSGLHRISLREDVMCGRYRLSRRKQLIAEYFDTVDEIDSEPRYNIAPTQNVGIIRQDRQQPVRKFSLVRWGLIPYWAKDPSIGQKMINARSETVVDKPAFREAFQSRRCLLPADGFYEWVRHEVACVIVRRAPPTGPAIPLAVLYEV